MCLDINIYDLFLFFRDVNEEASKDTHVYSSASDEDVIEIVPLDSQLEHPEHTNSDEDQNRRMDSGNQESNSEPEPESNPEPEPESDSEPESESEPGSDISQHEKELLDALRENLIYNIITSNT